MKRRTPPPILENPGKRIKLISTNNPSLHAIVPISNKMSSSSTQDVKRKDKQQSSSKPDKKRPKMIKLVPPRPFPIVAPSASATGPRSAQKEGRNYICLTRKTSLSAYMRRCKQLIINDGYKTLHLHAMGAAIPLLLQLTCALPPILPYSRDEVHTEVTTKTVELHDEIIPDDEDKDTTYKTRGKSTVYVIIKIGDGKSDKDRQTPQASSAVPTAAPKGRPKKTTSRQDVLVYEEPEQEMPDI